MPSDKLSRVGRRRKSAIVPGLVLGASFVAVVPVCAVACSGPGSDPITNMRYIQYGVAAVAYCCFEGGGVADVAFKPDVKEAEADAQSDPPSDAPSDSREGG